ncbi:hypothetical protein DYB36_009577 [Aphanomyces astaci]|uniref:Uncharacterized protein n=1 Tax=Aphanomyces astaci TaxID=112090 RepID=A0A397BM59_APHAT|nr:hypothetical protein DYB36_009577 [Aphanomyces astaci]
MEYVPRLDENTTYDIDHYRLSIKTNDLLQICPSDWELGCRERKLTDKSSEKKWLNRHVLLLTKPCFVYLHKDYAAAFLSAYNEQKGTFYVAPVAVPGKPLPTHIIHCSTSRYISSTDCVGILNSLAANISLRVIGYGAKAGTDSYAWIWDVASRSSAPDERPVIDLGVEFKVPHLAVFAARKHIFIKYGHGPYNGYDSMLWMNFMDYCHELQDCVHGQYAVGGGLSLSNSSLGTRRANKIKLYPKVVHFIKNINEGRIASMPHPSTNQLCKTRFEHLEKIFETYFKPDVAHQFQNQLTGFRVEITVNGFTLDDCIDHFEREFDELFHHVKVMKYPLPKYLANVERFVNAMKSIGPANGRMADLSSDKFKLPLAFVSQEIGMTSYICHYFLMSRAYIMDGSGLWSWCSPDDDAAVEDSLPQGELLANATDQDDDWTQFELAYNEELRETMLDIFLNIYVKSYGSGLSRVFKSRDKRSGRFSESSKSVFELAERIARENEREWRKHFLCKKKNLYEGLSASDKLLAFRRLVADKNVPTMKTQPKSMCEFKALKAQRLLKSM